MEPKTRNRKATALPGLRGVHSSVSMRSRRHNQLAVLRARVQLQVGNWEAEVQEMRARANAIECEAHQRIVDLLNNMKAQLLAGTSSPTSGATRLTSDSMHSLLQEWLSELGEMKASAYRADSEARHAFQHEADTLHQSMDECMRDWQRQITALKAQEEQFWNDTLLGEWRVTWQKLNTLGESELDAWQGFGAAIQIALQDAERIVNQATTGAMRVENLQQIISFLETPPGQGKSART